MLVIPFPVCEYTTTHYKDESRLEFFKFYTRMMTKNNTRMMTKNRIRYDKLKILELSPLGPVLLLTKLKNK